MLLAIKNLLRLSFIAHLQTDGVSFIIRETLRILTSQQDFSRNCGLEVDQNLSIHTPLEARWDVAAEMEELRRQLGDHLRRHVT